MTASTFILSLSPCSVAEARAPSAANAASVDCKADDTESPVPVNAEKAIVRNTNTRVKHSRSCKTRGTICAIVRPVFCKIICGNVVLTRTVKPLTNSSNAKESSLSLSRSWNIFWVLISSRSMFSFLGRVLKIAKEMPGAATRCKTTEMQLNECKPYRFGFTFPKIETSLLGSGTSICRTSFRNCKSVETGKPEQNTLRNCPNREPGSAIDP
mmetsp:Transcript_34498/g.89932  ORF Transcript_34498/g.89932 Transcript_34498/m.89932 type:complete len:212 (-) Transcript_34498:1475-2110(-)